MDLVTIDVETSASAPKPHFAASPHWLTNRVHLYGCKIGNDPVMVLETGHYMAHVPSTETTMVIGHNVKFDVGHICRMTGVAPRTYFQNRILWDTMLADYIMSGQVNKTRTLEALCAEEGIPFTKDVNIKAWFEAGNGADTFADQAAMKKYLEADVEATYALAVAQMNRCKSEQYSLIAAMMENLVALIDMEHTGLPYGFTAAFSMLGAAITARDSLLAALAGSIESFLGTAVPGCTLGMIAGEEPLKDRADVTSPTFLRKLLFATEIAYETREQVPTKKGTTRTRVKKDNKVHNWRPMCSQSFFDPLELTETGEFAVHEKAIETLLATMPTMWPRELKAVLGLYEEYKGKQKLISTYLEGSAKYVIHGRVHCNYNTCVTTTGRLSCSAPNLQNPPPEAKGCYVAPPGWTFMEIDYKQIEVLGLAVLSRDGQLIADLNSGVDIHSVLYAEMFGRLPDSAERKAFKPLTFGLIYGAGDRTLAANAGVSMAVVKKFRSVFFNRYPGVGSLYELVKATTRLARKPGTKTTPTGVPCGWSKYTAPTGRYLIFDEGPLPWDPNQVNFSPADLANWPVQSFATGDVVLTMVGVLARKIWEDADLFDSCLMVGTTHDSMLFLVENKSLDKAWRLCYNVLSQTSKLIADYYKMSVPVNFDFKATVGKSWQDASDDAKAVVLAAPL